MTLVSLAPEILECALPTAEELHKEIPLSDAHASFVCRSRETIEAILNGWDPRTLVIAGPCSIHEVDSALEYANRFRLLADQVSDKFFLIMRAYLEKPRTTVGWKGMLYDPDLDGSYNLAKGLRQTRQLLASLTNLGVPVGSELLEINSALYYTDFLSWGCIGARTCASPPHRQLASNLNFPIGFKNSVDGNIDHAIHGILSAATPHVFMGLSPSGQLMRMHAEGNSLCHVILRGGLSGPNFNKESILAVARKCRQAKVRDKIVVDCSHDNCGKKHLKQIEVFEEVIQQLQSNSSPIVGLMLESHLFAGAQELSSSLQYGVSVTDPCIDWATTEKIILAAYQKLSSR